MTVRLSGSGTWWIGSGLSAWITRSGRRISGRDLGRMGRSGKVSVCVYVCEDIDERKDLACFAGLFFFMLDVTT